MKAPIPRATHKTISTTAESIVLQDADISSYQLERTTDENWEYNGLVYANNYTGKGEQKDTLKIKYIDYFARGRICMNKTKKII